MSYYSDLKNIDVIEWIRPLIENKTYKMRQSDGRFVMCEMTDPHESPWHHIRHQPGAKCPYLHHQLFNVISPRTPAGKFVPRFCQECWKIVIRPHNLKQLFALEKVLVELNWPSKCGVEKRSYTPLSKYLYGGYIYSKSAEEGGNRLLKIREVLADTPGLEDVECYLKRACTEMELAMPHSNEWEVTDEQKRVEDILDWMIVYDIVVSETSPHLANKVHMGWIEWAAQHGDETYLDYTDGVRMVPDCVRYEPMSDEEIETMKLEGKDSSAPQTKE